ncbi:uncharacterized protein LOC115675598 [Syzygium oleosum]|uniref:uncharacterized protein LOC115675598 n=1 Tax=Syzygium oleosum TaxID=219896 RepID=UPI0011D1A918|nr:uncharacterized protein LOC115675598 [Syzygium oleosum]XP_056174480.1 uncharacterized protein LOC115675598 [Syzygium oleosum]
MALNVMSPGFEIGCNLKFQQRWEFRNGNDDLSSDDDKSNSSRHRASEKNELVHEQISLGDDESSYSRRPQEKEQAVCPDGTDQANEKTKKVKTRRKKDNSVRETKKRLANTGASTKKRKGIAYDPSIVSELRAFTKSVVQELEDERIKMAAWMREEIDKMVSGDASARTSRKDGTCSGDKTEPALSHDHAENDQNQHRKSSAKGVVLALQSERHKTRTHRGRNKREELQSQHQNSIEENVKMRGRTRVNDDAGAQKLKPTKKRQSKGRDSAQPAKRKKGLDPSTCPRPAENHVSNGRGSKSTTNDKEVPGTNQPIQSSDPSKSNLQLQPSKLDLSKGALDWNIGFLERPLASKIAPDSSNRQVTPDNRANCRTVEKENGQNSGFLSQISSLSDHSNPTGSPICSMFPTISKVDALSENCMLRINPVQSRFSQREALNPAGRLGSLAQACPRKESSSNRGGASEPTTQARLPMTLYQGMDVSFGNDQLSSLENLLRANESALGLRLSGGAMWSNRHGFSEYHVPNNFLGLMRPSSDGRLAAFQSPDPKGGC